MEPWSPNAGDLQPDIKVTAARVVEAIGNWTAGHGGPITRANRVEALGQSGRLGHAAYPSLSTRSDAAALQVIEAQYGGLLATTASVLVVCQQWRADSTGHVSAGGTTVDVRLTERGPTWRVIAVHPGVLPRPARPLSHRARAVLTEPRIELPPAARADVASGDVHDSVLGAMLRLAKSYRIGVSVVRTGHPTYVFGTDRVSDHALGRAFDTWRIDGHLVVDPATPRGLVTGYMEAAAAAGSYNIGGPYLMTGGAAQFFSDATHHDHVHAAFAT
jgi:hypothetical protein